MHQTIGFIVYAKNHVEAMDRVETVLAERLSPHYFDYVKPYKVYSIYDKEAKQIIKKLMDATEENFLENVKVIKRILSQFTPEEILNDRYGQKTDLFRHRCWEAGQYKGHTIFLYDNDAEGIRERGHLKDALEKWPDLREEHRKHFKDLLVWLVLADTHY